MSCLFFIPLACVAVFEAGTIPAQNRWVQSWLTHPDQGGVVGEEEPDVRDPEVDESDRDKGWKISRTSFDELVKTFPDTTHVSFSIRRRLLMLIVLS